MTRVKSQNSGEVNLVAQDPQKIEDTTTYSTSPAMSIITDSDEDANVSRSHKGVSRHKDTTDVKRPTGDAFPVKLLFEDFIVRYKILAFSPSSVIEPTSEHCKLVFQKAGITDFENDQDKVHISYADAAKLNQLRRDEERKIVRAQATVRGYLARSRNRKGQEECRDLSKIVDPMGLMKTQFDKLAESSPTSTLSTRSGISQLHGVSAKARKELEQNVFEKLKRNDKKYDQELKKVIQNLDRNPDLKILNAFSVPQPTSVYQDFRRDSAGVSASDDTLRLNRSGLYSNRGGGDMRAPGDASEDETPQKRAQKRHSRNSFKSNTTTTDSTATTNLSVPPTMEDTNALAWDMFRSVSRRGETFYETTTNWFQVAAKTVKVIAYIIIFIAVLACAVVSKASLLLMTQAIGNADLGNVNRDRWVFLLISAVCFPYIMIFIESSVKALFGNLPGPSIWNLIWVLVIESIHSFGLCLFLFRVLPCLDTVRCLLLMNALCAVPAILRLLATKRSDDMKRKVVSIVLDVLALLMQLSAFIVALASMKSECVQSPPSSARRATIVDSGSTSVWNFTYSLSDMSWEVPISLILISVKWWENFWDKDLRIGCLYLPVKLYKDSLHRCRTKSYLLASLWKIGVTFGFAYLLVPNLQMVDKVFQGIVDTPSYETVYNGSFASPLIVNMPQLQTNVTQDPDQPFPNVILPLPKPTKFIESLYMSIESQNCSLINITVGGIKNTTVCTTIKVYRWKQWQTYLPLMVQIASSGLCYYFARLACKLCMQRISFSIPLSLSTPLAVAVIITLCYVDASKLQLMSGFLMWTCTEGGDEKRWLVWHLGLGFGLWWTSQLWITRYIWTPKAPRLAFTERLFLLPQYCGALIEQSLLLNRRRNDKEKILKEMPIPDDISMDSSSTDATMRRQRDNVVPKIYICATMWHETEREMTELLMSVFRLDIDQSARKNAQDYFNVQDPDYYEFEAHIFVDDAMDFNSNGDWMPNVFVKQLVAVIDNAASAIHESELSLSAPVKIPTPYGGRLVWKLPGENLLIAHIKDKNKIRHKKRWSQVMYMYYLLGYRLLGQQDESLNTSTLEKDGKWSNTSNHFVKGNLFKYIPERVLVQAENTFILALDGDVDFKPHAVQLLVDRMKKNKKVGAACGRIHPIGGGALVWYQIFEYAIGHWLQKAAEHMLGCVLCSPGCFSLFRGSALMDDNVMRTYATRSSEARHYLQYDQGEDRWLSTLLLQQGYKMEYCAASDAMTHSPESFKEFFNQRRRWIPSTLANIMDLLQSFRTTVTANDNISYLYMAYQALLMISTVLGPATILLMMAGAINPVWNIELWQAYLLVVGPIAVYLILCFITKTETQLNLAAVLSAVYSLLMMAVIVGTAVQIAEDTIVSPNALFLMMLIAIFVLSAAFHPQEFFCLLPGALYFLALPSGYVLLMVYAMCNLHVVSWGTRETSSLEKKAQMNQILTSKDSSGFSGWIHRQEEESACCGRFFGTLRRICGSGNGALNTEILRQVIEKLDKVEAGMRNVASNGTAPTFQHTRKRSSSRSRHSKKSNKSTINDIEEEAENGDASSSSSGTLSDDEMYLHEDRDELINPKWIEDEGLKDGDVQYLPMREIEFWQRCIAKYLHPINPDKAAEAKIAVDLKSMRNNVAFAFFMMNAFWMVIIFMLQRVKDKISIPIPRYGGGTLNIEPLGLIFLCVFAFILLLQFLAMLRHRYGTLLHILASTELRVNKKKFNNKQVIRDIVEYAMKMQKLSGIDDDLTDQDYDYTSSSESRPHSIQPSSTNLYNYSSKYMSSQSLATEDSDIQIQPTHDPSYTLMLDNPGYQDSMSKLDSAEAIGDDVTQKEGADGAKKKGKSSKLRRSKSTIVDKNNTLRRQFERRYKRMLKNHTTETVPDPDFDPYTSRSLREGRQPNKRESIEDVVARFNNFNR